MNHYEAINDVLVHLFNEILDLEERALITPEYKDISVNDMHIIDAVGIQQQKKYVYCGQDTGGNSGNTDHCCEQSCKEGLYSAYAKPGRQKSCADLAY